MKLASQFTLKYAARRISHANRAYVCLGQFCLLTVLAALVSVHCNIVRHVFERRSPNEIQQPAISLNSIQVPAFHSRWAGSNEREKHEAMDLARFVFARLSRQIDFQVTLDVYRRFLALPFASEYPACVESTPNTAIVANSIAREAGNVAVLNNVVRMMLNHVYSSYGLHRPEPADVCASVRLASFYHQKQTCKSV
jgi:hypothetical protein